METEIRHAIQSNINPTIALTKRRGTREMMIRQILQDTNRRDVLTFFASTRIQHRSTCANGLSFILVKSLSLSHLNFLPRPSRKVGWVAFLLGSLLFLRARDCCIQTLHENISTECSRKLSGVNWKRQQRPSRRKLLCA